MKKITIYSILAAVLLFTACDIDRLPYGFYFRYLYQYKT
jgi:hypothetical protein